MRFWWIVLIIALASLAAFAAGLLITRSAAPERAEFPRRVASAPGGSAIEGGGGDRRHPETRYSRLAETNQRAKPILDSFDDDGDDGHTPAERELEARIEKALDDENLDAAIACAGEALKCPVVEIRQNMVDTLGWFGKKALPDLTPFLADADDDVRDSAKNGWMMALADIEDDTEKIGTVELAMRVLRDEDTLEEISDEYIGVDEKLAVESLVRIIDGGGSKEGIEKAKETYEFVTGDEWAGAEEAARWIAEEYEPAE